MQFHLPIISLSTYTIVDILFFNIFFHGLPIIDIIFHLCVCLTQSLKRLLELYVNYILYCRNMKAFYAKIL